MGSPRVSLFSHLLWGQFSIMVACQNVLLLEKYFSQIPINHVIILPGDRVSETPRSVPLMRGLTELWRAISRIRESLDYGLEFLDQIELGKSNFGKSWKTWVRVAAGLETTTRPSHRGTDPYRCEWDFLSYPFSGLGNRNLQQPANHAKFANSVIFFHFQKGLRVYSEID